MTKSPFVGQMARAKDMLGIIHSDVFVSIFEWITFIILNENNFYIKFLRQYFLDRNFITISKLKSNNQLFSVSYNGNNILTNSLKVN